MRDLEVLIYHIVREVLQNVVLAGRRMNFAVRVNGARIVLD